MNGFEWEFFHRVRGSKALPETTLDWFRRQPSWLKLAFVAVALPAWSVIAFNSLVGNPKDTSSVIAFILFALVTMVAIVAAQKRSKGGSNG